MNHCFMGYVVTFILKDITYTVLSLCFSLKISECNVVFILKMAGLFHGLELFIEIILKMCMEKINVKTAAAI